uniref:uncharacterized protein LOC120329870 n=1 Tax=Styela clava TaxID=7725 RepID=UPI00193930F3|nr:uncharacterized protein LOC120329870 [Styela clava]
MDSSQPIHRFDAKGGSRINNTTSPLVVIMPWLGATNAGINKYKNLYSKFGFETLIHYASLKDFLWPKSGLQSSMMFLRKLENILTLGNEKTNRNIIVHSFSIGCYFYSLMLMQMESHPVLQNKILHNISVQIMDSPVVGTLNQMAIGVGNMMSQNSASLASIYKHICMCYFALTKQHTVKYYNEAIEIIKFRAPKVPSLMMSSKKDPMLIPEAFEEFYQSWSKHQPVVYKMWDDSGHAQHLKYHPEEYLKLIENLLVMSLEPGFLHIKSKL